MASTPAENDWQAQLFTSCAIPACTYPVATPADVCATCQRAFGDMLHPQDGPAVDAGHVAAELAARDAGVLAQYRHRGATAAASVSDSTPKRNQACWLCEQRRTCTLEEMGWECERCREIES